ncbi:thioredoxin domain-containing protein [Geothermobacter hydrogeniphilus]|uniref:Thioredoxin domain-containing protein n=2 Tax=Geothermobacter hydrogeniphilus TaxID=1969733 RepID=A0A2K2HC25_9BACT|nr:thioredoxin domain-containing protein [Geothermobacter hydrogeniphilus]
MLSQPLFCALAKASYLIQRTAFRQQNRLHPPQVSVNVGVNRTFGPKPKDICPVIPLLHGAFFIPASGHTPLTAATMAVMTPTDLKQLFALDRTTLPENGGPNFNRLIFEQSPYLLQHADNPVDWYPWGDAAFEQARQLDRPVLLSIGYSTCHWCHVMAHESFASDRIAAVINAHFIAVKVDREERPDIDAAYMAVCQLMTGGGGWPLTLLLTPDRQPFYAATYLPPTTRGNQPGLLDLLDKVSDMWGTDRDKLLQSATQMVAALRHVETSQVSPGSPKEHLLQKALEQYRRDYDQRFAGFGSAPKFPAPHNLELLLRLARRDPSGEARQMALNTLTAIRRGGIYDQLGFGLHRYSVDSRWLVPHFEKMLYDQALLMLATTRAAQDTGEPLYSAMACETGSYLLRNLQHPEGGFYAGEDADSEGAEGTFYLWDDEEIQRLFPEVDAELARRAFGVTPAGNFEGRTILTFRAELQQSNTDRRDAETVLDANLDRIRETLLAARNRRPRPHRDEKLLTGWNGLALGALARTGSLFDRQELLQAAVRAADFILARLRRQDGRLLRRYCHNEAAIPGFLEDYAGLGFGLLELFLADFNPRWLEESRRLTEQMLDLFGDGRGGLYDTGRDAETVLIRGRNLQDGALPSGISVATDLLLQLGRLTGLKHFIRAGETLLTNHLGQVERYPRAYAWLLAALDSHLDPGPTLVIVPGKGKKTADWIPVARRHGPADLLLLVENPRLRHLDLPLLRDRPARNGQTTAYLCTRTACLPPITDSLVLQERLRGIGDLAE